jgi:predicted RNase H-like HicB family nuclease
MTRIIGADLSAPIELEHEDDGRWIAEVVGMPGVLAHGPSKGEAVARVQTLALHVLADRQQCSPEATAQ